MAWIEKDLYALITEHTPNIPIQLTVANQETGESHTINLATSEDVEWVLLHKYGDFKLVYNDRDDETFILRNMFENYLNRTRKVNFARLYEVFTYDYNPIENYDKTSTITLSFSGFEYLTERQEGSEKNTLEYMGKDTNTTKYNGSTSNQFTTPTAGYMDEETIYKSPEESTAYKGTQKISNKIDHRDETTTTTFTGRNDETTREFTDRKDVSMKEFQGRENTTERYFDDRKDVTQERTHGNIGVSTPMDMAMKEITARKFDLTSEIIKGFVMECCVL